MATNAGLTELFERVKGEIVQKFEEQNNKVIELKNWVAVPESIIIILLIKCGDNEQYNRRSCLRIHGTESDNNKFVGKG